MVVVEENNNTCNEPAEDPTPLSNLIFEDHPKFERSEPTEEMADTELGKNQKEELEHMSDPKIGTIIVQVDKGVSNDMEEHDVFEARCHESRPYYLTQSSNRIFVVNKSRINYFPNSEPEPEPTPKTMKAIEYRVESGTEEDAEQQSVTDGLAENDNEEDISKEKDMVRKSDWAYKLIQFYNDDLKEAARAVGIKQEALEGIRNSTLRCNSHKWAMLKKAVQLAETPAGMKISEISQVYDAVLEYLAQNKGKLNPVLVERTLPIVQCVKANLESMPKEMIDKLYWRCKKNCVAVLAEAHLQARSKHPECGASSVAHRLLSARLSSPFSSQLFGFQQNVSTASEKAQLWENGLFIPACENARRSEEAQYVYIPRQTLLKCDGLVHEGKLVEKLWFFPDENGRAVIHLNFTKVGKRSLDDDEIDIEESQTPLPVRIERWQCLFFSIKCDGDEVSQGNDVYDLWLRRDGCAVIGANKPLLIPLARSEPNSDDATRNFIPLPPRCLSKLETFFGIFPSSRDLISFNRHFLHTFVAEAEESTKQTGETAAEKVEEKDEPWSSDTEEMNECSEEEEELSLDGRDAKIGTILMRVPSGSSSASSKKERRYVYASENLEDKPYYLTKTFNRIFVVEKSRIDHFPGGIEPPHIRKAMKGWPNNAGEADEEEEVPREQENSQEEGAVEPAMSEANAEVKAVEPKEEPLQIILPDQKIGVIKVSLGKGGEGIEEEQVGPDGVVARDVFCCNLCAGKPYYLTQTGNKIFVVDKSRIILDNPPRLKRKRRPVYV